MKCRNPFIKKTEVEGAWESCNTDSKYLCYFLPSRTDRDGIWHKHLGFIVTNPYTFEAIMNSAYKREVWK